MKSVDGLDLNYMALLYWLYSEKEIAVNNALRKFGLLVYREPKRERGKNK